MKKLLLLLIIFISFSSAQSMAQDQIGYKHIKLGKNIKSVDDKLWPVRKDPNEPKNVQWYKYASRAARQAEDVKLKTITIKAEDDIIKEIVLRFKPEDKSDVVYYLEENYGKPNESGQWVKENSSITLTDSRAIFKLK